MLIMKYKLITKNIKVSISDNDLVAFIDKNNGLLIEEKNRL